MQAFPSSRIKTQYLLMEKLPDQLDKLPAKAGFVIVAEVAERASYYGMATILPIYLQTQFFEGNQTDANGVFHLFRMGAYFFPLMGALIADLFLGRFMTIMTISLLYVLGHFLLAVFAHDFVGFLAGLFLIALGSGAIKPNISTFLGDQVEHHAEDVRKRAFSYLYLAINVGGALASFLLPIANRAWGSEVAFAIPGVAMVLALVCFGLPSRQYVKHRPAENAADSFSRANLRQMLGLARMFLFLIVFFALMDENGGAWVFQAKSLDRSLFGYELLAEQIQTVQPVFVLLLVPMFARWIYPALERRGYLRSLSSRMLVGFGFLLASFVVILLLQVQIDAGHAPHMLWQVLAYLLLTVAEVLVYVSGLQMAFEKAPSANKSLVTAIFLLTISAGNLLVSLLGVFFEGEQIGSGYYGLLIGLMLLNTGLFYRFVGRKMVGK